MICALSGEAPEEPVVNVKTGNVFEKRVITKWLENNNNLDPLTKETVSAEDLVSIKVSKIVRPRPTTATSIPSALQLFQNEWDALMLETFTLRQQLDSARQELSHALYQHDAACRVIARLIRERDEARSTLANLRSANPGLITGPAAASSGAADQMEVEAPAVSISEDIKNKMVSKSQELSKERKKRTAPSTLATADDVKEFQVLSSNNLHKSSQPGVLCVDLHPSQDLVLTGGMDSEIHLFNFAEKKIVSTFSEHTKRVYDVLFHPTQTLFFSCSADKTAKVWRLSEGEKTTSMHTVTAHTNDVVGCTLQATGDYWVTASLDQTWAFHDLTTSTTLTQVKSDAGIQCVTFHPDGLILGTGGVDNVVKVWDIKSQKNVASFEGHKGKISDLAFSENGYYLATASADSTVKLWDLRKLKNFHTINLPEPVSCVDFDYSGTYLAVGAADVRIYMGKSLDHIATHTKHTATVNDVQWGRNAHLLVSVSSDRSLKLWGKK